jgi:hypothetical protein
MTYRQGAIILASDFNTFRTDVLSIWDVGTGNRGYGQIDTGGASAIPLATVDADILSAEWEAFRFAAQTCSDHQGSSTTFPPASVLQIDDDVVAHEFDDGNAYDVNSSLATIDANRKLFDAGSVSVFVNALNSTRNSSWNNTLQHRFTAVLPTVDDARYFFNSGGQIRIRGSRSGGSGTPQNASWTEILTNMGTIIFDENNTFQSGGGAGWTTTGVGYFDLTTSFQQIASGIDTTGGTYGSNEARVDVRSLDGPGGAFGDTGRQVEFRVRYFDNTNNPFADEVDGTITSDIDYQLATSPLTIQIPVFASSIVLTDGS